MNMSLVTSTERVPMVVMRTPVEIWQQIIDQVLFGPIIFFSDPFYPGCNLHTALNKWSNRKHLLNHEIQRGALRLVSQSWKALVDASTWQYFDMYRCRDIAQQRHQSLSARRLDMTRICAECKNSLGSRAYQCDQCTEHVECGWESSRLHIPLLDDSRFKAEILALPYWRESKLFMDLHASRISHIFPNLRALSISVDAVPADHLLLLFSRLKFLNLQLDKAAPGLGVAEPAYPLSRVVLPISTLRLLVSDAANIYPLRHWDMPFLVHLEYRTLELDMPQISTIGGDVWRRLISLRLCWEWDYVDFPGDMWVALPVLQYLGTTTLRNVQGPPQSHPLHTFAILEDEGNMDEAREQVWSLIEHWKDIITIADSHSWEDDIPPGYAVSLQAAVRYTTFEHGHNDDSFHGHDNPACWECLIRLDTRCAEYSLRYEDRMGRTYLEFQASTM